MTGRSPIHPYHPTTSRMATAASIHSSSSTDRYFPITTAVIPGYARNSPPLSNSLPSDSSSLSGSYHSLHHHHHHHHHTRDMMTIRAVSPDCEAGDDDDGNDTDDSLAAQHSPTTPPRTPAHTSRFDMMGLLGGHGHGQESPTDPVSPGAVMMGLKSQSRLLSRPTLTGFPQFADLSIRAKDGPEGTRRRGTSPTTERPNTMEVIQSPIHYHSSRYRSGPEFVQEGGATSVGFPSTQAMGSGTSCSAAGSGSGSGSGPGPGSGKVLVKTGKQRFLRNQASVSTLSAKMSESPTISSPVTLAPDSGAVFRLMKELRGRMEGYVEHRVGDNMVWVKGYCLINEDTGNLIHHRDENLAASAPTVIIPDLRGCQVKPTHPSDEGNDGIIEVSAHTSNVLIKLRPLDATQFMRWLAALLCWQPIPPAGPQNKMVKPQTLVLTQERKIDRRRNSDATLSKDAAIIKVGKMLLWRKGGPNSTHSPSSGNSGKNSGRNRQPAIGVTWQHISCTLQENGEFKMYAEADTTLLAVIMLQQLSRCAVQQLDPSILDKEFCIAVYPQYSQLSTSGSLARPVYLSIDSRILFEVWFVLLRAFTMPELYGPACMNPTTPSGSSRGLAGIAEGQDVGDGLVDSYRIQRSLFLRVVEAKITMPGGGLDSLKENLDCYAEVVLDGEVRAKTMVRTKTHNPFWREDYEFPDLPGILSDVGVVLKQRHSRWKTKGSGTVTGSGGFGGGLGGVSVPGSKDAVIGRLDISDELRFETDAEGWWPLMSTNKGVEEKVGEMFLKIGMEELIVLMAHEYKDISDLLHNFSSGITMEMAQVISPDLRRLADTLLKIYQVNGKASEWLMSLAEGEIDGLHKETIPMRPGLGRHRNSDESCTSDQDAPHPRREVSKSALMDANILFRGNSLLTKALDSHMKRLGREYLEETLGEHLWKIADEDTYCEVDPVRMEPGENLPKNWKVLMGIVNGIWNSIYKSPERCPIELRRVLKHIRACVEDRYGDLLKSVSYSSVCGFLFLRFFCPAILNPKLFGLLKDHPGVRAQRTLTLVAKSLQGLANMTPFGVKEPWMEPMNEFLHAHTTGLREFVDHLTNIPQNQLYAQETVPPSYATPITILSRLSQPSKEGFPSLPFLIDQPRAFAALVAMWLKWYPIHHAKCPEHHITGDLARFHELCLEINDRIRVCVEKAENAERPSSSLSARWEEVAEKATGSPLLGPGQVLTMFPMTTKAHRIVGLPSGRVEDDVNYTFGGQAGYAAQHRSKSKFMSGFVGGIKKKVKSRASVGPDHDEV